MKEKIGIITLHKNTNYGANLQAYASNLFIRRIGYECEIIDYTPMKEEKLNHLFSWLYISWKNNTSQRVIQRIKLLVALALSVPYKFLRLRRFKRFRRNYCKLSKPCFQINDAVSLNYTTVVCGSDQVWNPTITDGVNPIYFGAINGIKKRISFAASIGKGKLDEADEQKVAQLVKKIDCCSLREEDSAKYVSGLSGCSTVCVCDPVFLLEKNDYEKIISKRIIKKPYVLLYSIVSDEKMLEIARTYAIENNLKLVEICVDKNRHSSHKQLTSLGPLEFLSCVKYADTVFTNSFHGTAFSIIMEKEFYAVDNKNGGSRIVNLLSKAGLKNRLISEYDEIDNNSFIEYDDVKKMMQSYVDDSKRFLQDALMVQKKKVVNTGCMGCAACQAICNLDAIKILPNKEGFLEPCIDARKCVNCGKCQTVCPAMNEPVTNVIQNVYAFKAEDHLREKSASGGAFVALAKAVLSDGGVVWGAVQNTDFSVEHQRCDSFGDIDKIQGTKYVQSNLQKCYSELERDLKKGTKVLFSGTPCQIEAIKRFVLVKKLPKDNLYFVDIICHGVPSPKVYFDFINWLNKKKQSKVLKYFFRSKEISWRGNSCLVQLENGKKLCNDLHATSFMNLYYSNYITREACYSCKYATIARNSDITIGDYWGIENLNSAFEDELGVSAVLLNTDRGRTLFDRVQGEKYLGDITTLKQPQLTQGCDSPVDRNVFWKQYEDKGIDCVLNLYGGIRRNVLKEVLYSIKQRLVQKIKNR